MDPETEKKAEETGKSVLGRLKDWGCKFFFSLLASLTAFVNV